MPRLPVLAALALAALAFTAPAAADDTAEALALFREYVARSDRFDVGVADLYADDAAIKAKRLTADGRAQNLSFTGVQWKALIRQAMPLAQQRGDRNSFRDVSTKPSGADVMITANRYSHLKNYTSPWALLVRKDREGRWQIIAEVIETRP